MVTMQNSSGVDGNRACHPLRSFAPPSLSFLSEITLSSFTPAFTSFSPRHTSFRVFPPFSLAHTPRTSVPSVNPLASSFRSSRRTSALAVGERETALGTPTHKPRFPSVRESPGRPVPLISVFPLVARTQSTSHRVSRVARVRNPSAENRSHVQKLPFPVLLRVFCTHDIPHTYVHPLSLSLLLLRLPRTLVVHFVFASFRDPFPEFMVQQNSVPYI